jgi:hypothetical protein
MVEFNMKCRACSKAITLRVRDRQAQAFFEEHGALCAVCYQANRQPAAASRMGWQEVTYGHLVHDESGRAS